MGIWTLLRSTLLTRLLPVAITGNDIMGTDGSVEGVGTGLGERPPLLGATWCPPSWPAPHLSSVTSIVTASGGDRILNPTGTRARWRQCSVSREGPSLWGLCF